MSGECEGDESYYDPFYSPGIRWTEEHGEDPDKWPLPPGQPLTWAEWARELSAEAVRQDFRPEGHYDFLPKNDEEIRDMATTCWIEDWLAGKTPAQIIGKEVLAAAQEADEAARKPSF